MRNKVDFRAIAGIAVVAALSLAAITQALFAQVGPPVPKHAPFVEKNDLLVDPAGQPIRGPLNPGNAEPPRKQEEDSSLFPDGIPALEEILTAALQENPDIRVAQAKVREAEAALNQARLSMIRQAVTLRQSILQQQAELKILKVQFANATMSPSKLAAASQALTESEAQLLYLMGRTPPGVAQAGTAGTGMKAMVGMMGAGTPYAPAMSGGGIIGGGAPGMMGPMAMGMMGGMGGGGFLGGGDPGEIRPAIPRGKMGEQLRAALDMETPVEFNDTPLPEAIQFLAESTGQNMIVAEDFPDGTVTLTLKKAPLGAVLQALKDRAHIEFYVRDYGMLVTTEGNGPEDGLSAHEFWQMPQPPSRAK